MFLFECNKIIASYSPFPNLIFQLLEQVFRRGFAQESALVDQDDVRGSRFDVRNDVGGQDDDALALQV